MNFTEAEQAYLSLVEQKQAGLISDIEFHNAVQNLRIQTQDGTWWQIRVSDGVWLRWDGSSWLPSQYKVESPKKSKKKRSPIATCFIIIGIFACLSVCLLAAIGAGGYYAISTGNLNQRVIMNTIGMGSGEITIINISDDSLITELIQLETESGMPETMGREEISPLDISGYGSIQPGWYEIHITSPSGAPPGGVCLLNIASGDSYQFVAVPKGVAITLADVEVQNPDDVDMSTSGLCR